MKYVILLPLEFYFFYLHVLLVDCQDITPRVSNNGSTASIVVRSASNTYGVLSVSLLQPYSDGMVSEGSNVSIAVSRIGGSSGPVSARVRTVGGGESYSDDFGSNSDTTNDTIGYILQNRDITRQAIAGQDYVQLDTQLDFVDSEASKTVYLSILNNTQPEFDENVFVYVKPLTTGVAVARPSVDSGLKGYAILTIRRHGLYDGLIGFLNSTVVADKDSGQNPVLTIERQNATPASILVYWRASDGGSLRFPPINLADLLQATSGSVNCAAVQRLCTFTIPLVADKKPRNETWFLVEIFLDPSTVSAVIDSSRRICNVTLLKTSYPNGLVQFAQSSRTVILNKNSTSVDLVVERLGYLDKVVTVTYTTVQLDAAVTIAGTSISPALDGIDYVRSADVINFAVGINSRTITVSINPSNSSYPKMFQVQFLGVTGNPEVGVQVSNVIIVETTDEPFWQVWDGTQDVLTNDTILTVMQNLRSLLPRNITNPQMMIVQNILNSILTVNEYTPLAPATRIAIMDVFCGLLQPGKSDATNGYWPLSKQLERYAYASIDRSQCDKDLNSPDCAYVNFQVYRKYPDDINSMQWTDGDQNSFNFPSDLLPVETMGRYSSNPVCFTLAMIDYKTVQWFPSGGGNLLNNRILSASIQGQNSRSLSQPVAFTIRSSGSVAPVRSDCVYFNEDYRQWTNGSGVCSVRNNLALSVDNYVSCTCAHMSAYAVQVRTDSYFVGYPIWFHISCFICIGCLTLVILTHHLCHTSHLFPINLLLHMCFAIIATEICYVIDGFLSPWHILNVPPGGDNYRCLIMSLFMHYFFVAQFCWLTLQAVNLYRVLLLNDENSKRFYLIFFLVGWGSPFFFVGFFYLVVYLIYRFATNFQVDKIYGDVLGNSNFCFLTNAYAALGGILLPCAVCLLIVGAICVQVIAMHQQWEDYDNIYIGKRNIIEMKILLGFWSIFVLTCLWMTLHVSLGQMWTLVLFVIFNIVLGLYGLVAYAILRWAVCFELCVPNDEKKSPKTEFKIDAIDPSMSFYSQPNRIVGNGSKSVMKQESVQPSQKKSLSDSGSETRQPPTLHVRRSAPNPTEVQSPYDKRPTLHGMNILEDFDDIIYSLNVDGRQDYKPTDRKYDRRHPLANRAPSETSFFEDDLPVFYEKKRINIADTHI